MKFTLKNRFWIGTEKGPFLRFGRIELLEKIDELGSIKKAAQAMNMAYRQAWRLVKSMNEKAEKPLVIKQTGGNGGGGTKVTAEGQRVILLFKTIEADLEEFLSQKNSKLNS